MNKQDQLTQQLAAPLMKKGKSPRRSLLMTAMLAAMVPHAVWAVMSTNTAGPIHGRQIAISTPATLNGEALIGQTLSAAGQQASDLDNDAFAQWNYKWQRSSDQLTWTDQAGGSGAVVSDYVVAAGDQNQYLRLCLVAEAATGYPESTKLSAESCQQVGMSAAGDVTLAITDPGAQSTAENNLLTIALAATTNVTSPNLTWSIEGGADAALFTIDPATGILSLAAQDFENPADADDNNIYQVKVKVTEAGSGNSTTRDLDVSVTDVMENMAATWSVVQDDAAADGSARNSLRLTLLDGNSQPVLGESIAISTSPLATLVGSSTLTTDANGEVLVELTHNAAEVITVIAAWDDAGTAGTAQDSVTFTVSNLIAATDGVLVVDAANAPIAGNPVVGSTLHSRVTLQGETSIPAIDRTQTPGGKTITYQWQRSVTGANTWTDVNGATGASYDLRGNDQGYDFRVDANVQP